VINNADILSTLVGGHVMPGYLRVEMITGDTSRQLDRLRDLEGRREKEASVYDPTG
jgi:hypothetical protein